MTAFFRILVTFVLALAVGAVVGWSWLAPKQQPPALTTTAPRVGANDEQVKPHTTASPDSDNPTRPSAKPKSPTAKKRGSKTNKSGKRRPTKNDSATAPASEVLVPSQIDK